MTSNTALDAPNPLLPDDSFLTLDEYLELVRTASQPLNFRLLRVLLANDSASLEALASFFETDEGVIECRLHRLVKTGLVRREEYKGSSRYRATPVAERLLHEGILSLMNAEFNLSNYYS